MYHINLLRGNKVYAERWLLSPIQDHIDVKVMTITPAELAFYFHEYRLCGHNPSGPATIIYDKDGNVITESWLLFGQYHNPNGPAIIEYLDGKVTSEQWYLDGKRHNPNGPAKIQYSDGKVICEEWYQNDELMNKVEM